VKSDKILVQDKLTAKDQLTVHLKDLKQLEHEARKAGLLMPVFTLSFEGRARYYAVPEDWFVALLERLNET
jgi:hypothetical protein